MNKIHTIQDLVDKLNKASEFYYNTGDTIMNDQEFDSLLDKLAKLEEDTGFVLSSSPTHNVGAKVLSQLNKVSHDIPMLSLDKCHTTEEIMDFVGNDDCFISWKYDGLSTRLIYENGQLVSAATRGNGVEGTDITEHVKHYDNIPMVISHKERFVIDGESIILDQDFQDINSKLPENEQFKNSRNLASGTLNNLDMNVVKERHMKFFAWRVIEGFNDIDNHYTKLQGAYAFGFEVGLMTPCCVEDRDNGNINMSIDLLRHAAIDKGIQIDGLVIAKCSAELSNQMGRTEKFFRHSIAYKFKDETYETELLNIEWTVGRTGTITPTAVFKPVIIDGTTVERASVHNVSVLTQLDLHIGDKLEIIKSNQIIPQVHRNISAESRIDTDYIVIPATCPVCGGIAEIKETDNSKILVCTNPDCAAKKLAQFTHFVSRNCMNIEGLSERTLETFISLGYLKTFRDIYYLHIYRNKLIHLDGFGPKSIDKLLASIERSREVKLENFIAALGIPNIGLSAAKTISKAFNNDHFEFVWALNNNYDFTQLDDFGDITNQSLHDWWESKDPMIELLPLEMNFIIPKIVEVKENPFTGKNICVTGKLHSFTRNSINEKIVSLGAKAVGSVSSKTDYLITNEQNGSSKYKKAVELNTPIITEDEFLNMLGE